MKRTLIVARLNPADARPVADIFAESDQTELPHLIGVEHRSLFRFHDLYFHLVETNDELVKPLYANRSHPLYDDINQKLAVYMRPYDPSWKEPKDSMATEFYRWDRNGSSA